MTEDVQDVIEAWRIVHLHKLFPAPGGQDQQSAWFLEAIAVLDSERARFEEEEIKRRSKAARR